MRDLGQLITAMVTPFNEKLEVDYKKAAELAVRLADSGSESILVAGTTGESPALTHDEKIKLFQAVKEAVGDRIPIIAGTGTNNTSDTIAFTKEAEEIGVDAALIVCPYYNKPPQEGIYAHYKAIAQTTNLPIIVYNIPGRTGVNITPETMAKLSQIPNIIADKEASGSVEQCSQMVIATGAMGAFAHYASLRAGIGEKKSPENGKKFAVYSGDDSLILPMMSVGAVGIISVASHIAGKEISSMIAKFFSGDYVGALEIHNKLMPLFKGLFATTNPILVKSALRMTGFDAGGLRPPLVNATSEQEKALAGVLQQAGIL